MAALRLGLQDEVDDVLGDDVGEAEVGAGDDHEADHDGGRLADLTAVGPLHALKLGPAGAHEADEAVATGVAGGLVGRRAGSAAATRAATATGDDRGVGGPGQDVVLGVLELLELLLGDRVELLGGVVLDVGLALGAGDDRRLELVDVARRVLERPRNVVAVGLGRPGARVGGATTPLPITARHGALPRLPMRRVLAAPPAVLGQRDAIGVVALGLVGLVVAALAVLACEGDSDPHVSASHGACLWVGTKERPAGRASRPGSVAIRG